MPEQWIIMGVDECGSEFRPNFSSFASKDLAYHQLDAARDAYPEARRLWVELLKDKDFYMEQHMRRGGDWWEEYDD